MTIRLSILDQSPVNKEENSAAALQNTVKIAQEAEALGYERFWVSEHHNAEDYAGSAPEILLAFLAAKTQKIKLASGGVMLQHYNAYKVAEQFHVLANLTAPERIAVGLGKAPGGLSRSTEALQANFSKPAQSFESKFEELVHFVRNDFPKEHPFAEVSAEPKPKTPVEVFLLGGSVASAIEAAELNTSFVYAYHINGDEKLLEEVIRAYRSHLPNGSNASFQLSPIVFTAESQEKAESYVTAKESIKIVFENGKKLNIGTAETAQDYLKKLENSDEGPYELFTQTAGVIAGTKETVAKELKRLSEKFAVYDFILLSPIPSFSEKLKSYRLIAEEIKKINALEESVNV